MKEKFTDVYEKKMYRWYESLEGSIRIPIRKEKRIEKRSWIQRYEKSYGYARRRYEKYPWKYFLSIL